MSERLVDYALWKADIPIGRMIGDRSCHYDRFMVYCVRLTTDAGRHGWGYGEVPSGGAFAVPAPWIVTLPPITALRARFAATIWPHLAKRSPLAARLAASTTVAATGYEGDAVRMALWDLIAQGAGLPLHRLLGAQRDRVRAYGSALDFPLDDSAAIGVFQSFAARGFTAVKVKVGAPDVARDIARLKLVRVTVGDDVEIAIDANEAWDFATARDRLARFVAEGLAIAYVEDPLPRKDFAGLAALVAAVPIDIVAHDYIVDPVQLAELAAAKGVDRIRISGSVDYARAGADIGAAYDLPLIMGNSALDVGVHAAVALSRVERMEFSDVWPELPENPVRFEDGFALAPDGPGHGLAPDMDVLARYSVDD